MESDSGNRQGVICWLCSKDTAHFFGEICDRTFALCEKCHREYYAVKEKKEREYKKRLTESLLRWLTEQRTVKRFDRAQHNLFKGSGQC